jgi:hypothetical protein
MVGLRSILPEHDGQLSGEPFRSLTMRCNACAGLYVAGRGLRMETLLKSRELIGDEWWPVV